MKAISRLAVKRAPVGGQHHVEDLAPELPDHRQDRAQLDDDVERHGAFAAKTDQVGDDDLVPVLEIGKNSVRPSTTPKMIACKAVQNPSFPRCSTALAGRL
jgi:hypothetical protein